MAQKGFPIRVADPRRPGGNKSRAPREVYTAAGGMGLRRSGRAHDEGRSATIGVVGKEIKAGIAIIARVADVPRHAVGEGGRDGRPGTGASPRPTPPVATEELGSRAHSGRGLGTSNLANAVARVASRKAAPNPTMVAPRHRTRLTQDARVKVRIDVGASAVHGGTSRVGDIKGHGCGGSPRGGAVTWATPPSPDGRAAATRGRRRRKDTRGGQVVWKGALGRPPMTRVVGLVPVLSQRPASGRRSRAAGFSPSGFRRRGPPTNLANGGVSAEDHRRGPHDEVNPRGRPDPPRAGTGWALLDGEHRNRRAARNESRRLLILLVIPAKDLRLGRHAA